MDRGRSLRQRLQSTVLEASTLAGKTYNAVIFGVIVLSVAALLLEAEPLGNSALRQTNVPLDRSGSERLLGGVCCGFISPSGLGGEASPLPVQLHRTD